ASTAAIERGRPAANGTTVPGNSVVFCNGSTAISNASACATLPVSFSAIRFVRSQLSVVSCFYFVNCLFQLQRSACATRTTDNGQLTTDSFSFFTFHTTAQAQDQQSVAVVALDFSAFNRA